VFVIQLRRAMPFLLTSRLSEQRKLSNRNATTRKAPGGPQMQRNAGGPEGNLVVAVAVQYTSWGTFEAIARWCTSAMQSTMSGRTRSVKARRSRPCQPRAGAGLL